MADEEEESPSTQPEGALDAPLNFITFRIGENGHYILETNLGDGWQVHILRIAKKIREELY